MHFFEYSINGRSVEFMLNQKLYIMLDNSEIPQEELTNILEFFYEAYDDIEAIEEFRELTYMEEIEEQYPDIYYHVLYIAEHEGPLREIAVSSILNWEKEKVLSKERSLMHSKTRREKRLAKSSGFVYVIKADNGLCKIGQSSQIEKRMLHFTAKLPYELKLIAVLKSENRFSLEENLHSVFSEKRVRGEWFNLSQDDIEWILSEYRGIVTEDFNEQTFD